MRNRRSAAAGPSCRCGTRDRGERVGSSGLRVMIQSAKDQQKGIRITGTPTRMTGRWPCTRFSSTSPSRRPAFMALSCDCTHVLSSPKLAILYTDLYQVISRGLCDRHPTHIGRETAMKYADKTVRLMTSFLTYPFNLLVTQLSIALPVCSMCSVS